MVHRRKDVRWIAVFAAMGLAWATCGIGAASAQTAKPAAKPAQVAAPTPTVPAEASTPPKPIRSESTAIENWVVTCQEFADAKVKKVCNAQTQVSQANTGQVVFLWVIAPRDDGQYEAVLRVPTGVVLGLQIEFTAGTAPTRKIPYATCEPTFCTANFITDAALLKELLAADKVSFVFYGTAGNKAQADIPMKDFSKVIASLRH